MQFAGIITEYDPLHNGHAWQLAAARALGAQHIAVAMSCSITQRGTLPLLPEHTRAGAALAAGAHLVFALPAPCACAGAEAFARAGVALLAAAGCDALVFGAEDPDPARLMAAARVLCSEEYTARLRYHLAHGARSFAQARQLAAGALLADGQAQALLAKPNNNLAVEYCKAILQLGYEGRLVPVPLPRLGAQHGGGAGYAPLAPLPPALQNAALPGGPFASASALRRLWAAGGPNAIAPYVPAAALELYRAAHAAGEATDPARAEVALLARLRGQCITQPGQPAPFGWVRGVSEGLEHRLAAAVAGATSAPQLYNSLTTARYPRARMRRLCTDAALGYAAPGRTGPCGQAAPPALPPYLHLLAARRSALPLLQNAALPVSASLAKLARVNDACACMARAQAAAADFGALCRRTAQPMGGSFTQAAVFLP